MSYDLYTNRLRRFSITLYLRRSGTRNKEPICHRWHGKAVIGENWNQNVPLKQYPVTAKSVTPALFRASSTLLIVGRVFSWVWFESQLVKSKLLPGLRTFVLGVLSSECGDIRMDPTDHLPITSRRTLATIPALILTIARASLPRGTLIGRLGS